MYIIDGIAYAGEPKPPLAVSGVRPMEDYTLWVRFNTGETKLFDCKPLLETPAFSPLKEETAFRSVYIDRGCPVWSDGDIDIAPEYLYQHGVSAEAATSA